MIKISFAFITLIHGLIHFLGFFKEWKLANVQQLNGQTLIPLSGNLAKISGIFWLLTGILFVILAVSFLLKKEWWWMLAAITILLSQSLIILYWQDAKFGTIANIIVLITCIMSYGSWSFNKIVDKEINSFFPVTFKESEKINDEMIANLPPVVQKWLKHANIIGKEMTQTVYLTQIGEMKTTKEGKWLPFEAKQYFTVNNPGFIWKADVGSASFINFEGRDKYFDGKGHMLIKLFSLFPVADAKGKEMDHSSMIRYLSETIWFPSSALRKYIIWEEIDSLRAKATMSYKGITASGVFTFNLEGDLISFEAKRYYARKDNSTLEDWLVKIDGNGYKEFEGIRIPAKATVTWKLKEGDFNWLKIEIKNLKYNLSLPVKNEVI